MKIEFEKKGIIVSLHYILNARDNKLPQSSRKKESLAKKLPQKEYKKPVEPNEYEP